MCIQDLTGDTVKTKAIGNPRIFGDGFPAGYHDAYPTVNGIGSPNRAYFCGFYLSPPPGSSLPEEAWLLAIDLDSGSLRSSAKKGFPLGVVDLSFVDLSFSPWTPNGTEPAPVTMPVATPPNLNATARRNPRMGKTGFPDLQCA